MHHRTPIFHFGVAAFRGTSIACPPILPRRRERKHRDARVCTANRGKYENVKATMHRRTPEMALFTMP